ncbi:hypothetical protein SAMN04489725_12023 [Alicyclobacillus hesperidum]|uniref:Uncharacterized protein n=1 Tax=Alicyclobacillus hesperidum TaxID=89784 RepID=A0A1H2XFA0_9BACL|nr:YeeE/YedE family protein [Alicyclobacillus hesperidum]SDW91461.1 hypothetical protein SAMN04489725_12023 [Alicyclobacillus hesperidum]
MAKTESNILQLDAFGYAAEKEINGAPRIQVSVVLASLLLLIAGALYLGQVVTISQAFIYLISGVLGLGLYHAHYGFTSSFRRFLVHGRGVGLRAQMVMFLITNLLFLPLLIQGHALGHTITGYVSPVGLSVLIGSFLFGIGMQLGDGCASGSLYHTGGGDFRGILAIAGFVIGSVLGTINFTWWMATPHFQPVSFLHTFGIVGGFAFNLLLMAVVFVVTWFVEKARRGQVESFTKVAGGFSFSKVWRGPWSWIAGSVLLAFGNVAILLLSGKPWGVTSAFALWGAKLAQPIGIPVTHWGYWTTPANAAALNAPLSHDVTTVMDVGIVIGSLLAAGLAGKFPRRYFHAIPLKMAIGVLIGGVCMGYGARIAFGCNIGAFFSGIASFSLHGWEWFLGALIGSAVGIVIRPYIGLSKE